MRLSQIAREVGGELWGADAEISALAAPGQAGAGELVAVRQPTWLPSVLAAGAFPLGEGPFPPGSSGILVASVEEVWPRLLKFFDRPDFWAAGIHPSALIEAGVTIDPSASVGPFAWLQSGVVVGPGVVIGPYCHLGNGVNIGADTCLEARVTLHRGVTIGQRCHLMSGVVVGATGFGFGPQGRLAHTGTVTLEDDVELGPLVVVERAIVGAARIGRGSKIGGGVYIGHNADIGQGVIIVSQTGLAGSVKIENGAMIGPQAGISDHVVVGAGAKITGQSGVTKNVPAGETWSSVIPARPIRAHWRWLAALNRLVDKGES